MTLNPVASTSPPGSLRLRTATVPGAIAAPLEGKKRLPAGQKAGNSAFQRATIIAGSGALLWTTRR